LSVTASADWNGNSSGNGQQIEGLAATVRHMANVVFWPFSDDRTRATGTTKTAGRVTFLVFPTFLF
jgi:hypothetical protein